MSSIAAAGRQGDDILARVAANTKPANVHSRIYWTQKVPVAAATLRRGALAALGRGVMHPGLQAAVLAAGFILGTSDNDVPENEIYAPDEGNSYPDPIVPDYDPSVNFRSYEGDIYNTPEEACGHQSPYKSDDYLIRISFVSGSSNFKCYWGRFTDRLPNGKTNDTRMLGTTSEPANQQRPPADYAPVDESQYPLLDPHIPASLLDELVNSQDDIPEWQEAISVLPGPESAVVPTQSQNIAPEIATAVGRRGENIRAQSRGDNPPYSDAGTDGHSAEDQNREDWEQPIPPFPDVDPEWQVETIDSLPSYSIGLGGGSCPGATQIPVPFGGSITLDWQPACNLAGMLRGAVIGVCMILSLYIVLRGN